MRKGKLKVESEERLVLTNLKDAPDSCRERMKMRVQKTKKVLCKGLGFEGPLRENFGMKYPP